MYTKIYFGPKPLYLCDTTAGEIEDYVHRKETLFIDELNQHTIDTMIHEMQKDVIYAGVFQHRDLDQLLNAFKKTLRLVQAAGGFVIHKNEVLLIFRRGKWDLPKGKLDEGEDLKTCAIREVQEETGLQKVSIDKPLITTYHTYHEGTNLVLKECYWFLMNAVKRENLSPQKEEGIEKCEWVNIDAIEQYMSNTHFSILDVVNCAKKELVGAK
ncbi:MAG: NUDIX hydrolase [Chitinophagaceae bacterium]